MMWRSLSASKTTCRPSRVQDQKRLPRAQAGPPARRCPHATPKADAFEQDGVSSVHPPSPPKPDAYIDGKY